MQLIIFDLDHTLLAVNSSFRFGFFLYRKGVFSFWTLMMCLVDYLRYKWFGLSIPELHQKAFKRIFSGKSQQEICLLAEQFVATSLPGLINDAVYQRLKKEQDHGYEVAIVSSSPDFLVEPVAHYFHVSHWKGTSYEIDARGNFSAVGSVMAGEMKQKYLESYAAQTDLPLSSVTVYSDSYLDFPILKIAGRAIAVRPDSRLKQMCLKYGWESLGDEK